MVIQQALEIAKNCGLRTVGKALANIDIHAMNLFVYSEINSELNELWRTWKWVKENRKVPDGTKLDESTEIDVLLNNHLAEDLSDYEKDKNNENKA